MPDNALTFFAQDATATDKFANALADIFSPGDLLLLEGEMGAGKSALARALIRCLLNEKKLVVPSPTYLLVLPYDGLGMFRGKRHQWSILHADLFRLNQSEELAELGLFDEPETLKIVEWPERAPTLFDEADMVISLSIPAGGVGRNISINATKNTADLVSLSQNLEEAG